MVRVDGTYPVGRVDWNATARLDVRSPLRISITTETTTPTPGRPSPDGTTGSISISVRVGARRVPGILSLEIARDDLPESDPIFGDWGYGDWGYGDWGYGDWGYGDWGYGDWGYGDWGYGDWGYEPKRRSTKTRRGLKGRRRTA